MWAIFVCFGFYIMKLSHEPRPLWRPRVSTRLPLQDVFHWKVKCVAPSLNTKSNPKLNLVSDTVSGIWSIGPHTIRLEGSVTYWHDPSGEWRHSNKFLQPLWPCQLYSLCHPIWTLSTIFTQPTLSTLSAFSKSRVLFVPRNVSSAWHMAHPLPYDLNPLDRFSDHVSDFVIHKLSKWVVRVKYQFAFCIIRMT